MIAFWVSWTTTRTAVADRRSKLGLERVGRYQPMIEQILKEEGVPLDLIYLCQAESAFQPRALSRAKAKGMWQFISSRGKEYGLRQTWWIDERSDPGKIHSRCSTSSERSVRGVRRLVPGHGRLQRRSGARPARDGKDRRRQFLDTGRQKRALPKGNHQLRSEHSGADHHRKESGEVRISTSQPEPPLETERVPVDKATDLAGHRGSDQCAAGRPAEPQCPRPAMDDASGRSGIRTDPAERLCREIHGSRLRRCPKASASCSGTTSCAKATRFGAIAKKYGTSVAELTQANNLPQESRPAGRPVSDHSDERRHAASGCVQDQPQQATCQVRQPSYTVRRGDTLAKIAARFKVSVDDTAGVEPSLLYPSDCRARSWLSPKPSSSADASHTPAAVLPKVVHKVRPGETLDRIATAYKTTVDAILSWNKENDLSVIHPGDQNHDFPGRKPVRISEFFRLKALIPFGFYGRLNRS